MQILLFLLVFLFSHSVFAATRSEAAISCTNALAGDIKAGHAPANAFCGVFPSYYARCDGTLSNCSNYHFDFNARNTAGCGQTATINSADLSYNSAGSLVNKTSSGAMAAVSLAKTAAVVATKFNPAVVALSLVDTLATFAKDPPQITQNCTIQQVINNTSTSTVSTSPYTQAQYKTALENMSQEQLFQLIKSLTSSELDYVTGGAGGADNPVSDGSIPELGGSSSSCINGLLPDGSPCPTVDGSNGDGSGLDLSKLEKNTLDTANNTGATSLHLERLNSTASSIERNTKNTTDSVNGLSGKLTSIELNTKNTADKSTVIEQNTKGTSDNTKNISDKSNSIEQNTKGTADNTKNISDDLKSIKDSLKEPTSKPLECDDVICCAKDFSVSTTDFLTHLVKNFPLTPLPTFPSDYGTCPIVTFDVVLLNMSESVTAHCTILEANRKLLNDVSLFIWAVSALMIVLSA